MKVTSAIILTEDQIRTLRGALRGHDLEAILTLALVTRMRRDELLNLKWQQVDLDTLRLTVRNSKTQSNDRVIPLPPDIAEILKQHRLRQREAQEQAGLTWANLDLVFCDHVGERLTPQQLVRGFHEICTQAELPQIRFHDLRMAKGHTLHKRKGDR